MTAMVEAALLCRESVVSAHPERDAHEKQPEACFVVVTLAANHVDRGNSILSLSDACRGNWTTTSFPQAGDREVAGGGSNFSRQSRIAEMSS